MVRTIFDSLHNLLTYLARILYVNVQLLFVVLNLPKLEFFVVAHFNVMKRDHASSRIGMERLRDRLAFI
jgi:hypothetical protein